MTDTYLTRQTLLRRLKSKNDEQSWEEFISFYEKFIYSIIHKMDINSSDCDDLAQKVLLKVWKSLANFDYNQQQGYFRNWLYTITKNTVLTYISDIQYNSNANKQVMKDADTDYQPPEIDTIIQNEWEKHISERAFQTIKETVSEQMLDVFLSTLRGESITEIAERVGLEENTIYKYKNRVKHKLMAEIRNLREMLE